MSTNANEMQNTVEKKKWAIVRPSLNFVKMCTQNFNICSIYLNEHTDTKFINKFYDIAKLSLEMCGLTFDLYAQKMNRFLLLLIAADFVFLLLQDAYFIFVKHCS